MVSLALLSMEQDILHTLQEIRGYIFILTVCVCVSLTFFVFNWISNIYSNFKKEYDNYFVNEASRLFELGKYSDLISHCNEKLQKYPNHTHAKWWLAKVKLSQGNNDEASILFKELSLIEPDWKEKYIDPYLEQIEKSK